jgi:Fringe-like
MPIVLVDPKFGCRSRGGEDDDFFSRVSKKLNIIRAREKGLTHVWHAKQCRLGGFVGKKYFRACVGAMSHVEGSQLGLYLMHLKSTDRSTFDDIMNAMAKRVNIGDNHTSSEDDSGDASDGEEEENRNVLVAIVSSRQNFGTRVKGIIQTWADPSNTPDEVTIRIFVGAPPQDSEYYGRPEEDVANLAKIAGIDDLSTVVVMNDVADDEYPPVRRNSAMIVHLDKIAQTFEGDAEAPFRFQWIYKVDDDAYVNFDGLMSFLKTRHAEGYHVYGERGYGRKQDELGLSDGGLVKPYCTGGPGYIMSRQTVSDTAPHMMDCVRTVDKSNYREFVWHSDSVIGICIYNSTGAGCWDDHDYEKNRIFRHNLKKKVPFPRMSDLPKVVATHPFKDAASMEKQHSRYLHLEYAHGDNN